MRVAFLAHYVGLYGANRSLLNLIDGVRRYGVDCFVVAPGEGAITDCLRQRGLSVVTIPMAWWAARIEDRHQRGKIPPPRSIMARLHWRRGACARLLRNLRSLPALVHQLRAWEVDVVYSNSSVIPLGAMAASILGLPHVWHLREFVDLDYGLRYDWGRRVFRRFLRRAEATISISQAVRSYHLAGAESSRAYVIYNGVAFSSEFEDLYRRANFLIAENSDRPFTFVIPGLIHPAKSQEVAIRALSLLAKENPEVRLLIVGDGDDRSLRNLTEELGITSKVEFWGYIEDPFRAYLASDAVLMCSRYEAMGRVTVEAMAACRPVIGYDQAGTSEIVQHEHTGLLYRGGAEALAECMRRLVEDPSWARQLGINGWRLAREKYTIEAYAERVYQVLVSVSGGRSSAPAPRG